MATAKKQKNPTEKLPVHEISLRKFHDALEVLEELAIAKATERKNSDVNRHLIQARANVMGLAGLFVGGDSDDDPVRMRLKTTA